jgi:hypothetical protein
MNHLWRVKTQNITLKARNKLKPSMIKNLLRIMVQTKTRMKKAPHYHKKPKAIVENKAI